MYTVIRYKNMFIFSSLLCTRYIKSDQVEIQSALKPYRERDREGGERLVCTNYYSGIEYKMQILS